MEFRTGDKVKFLNQTGGGIISKIISPSMVKVAIEDGFEISCPQLGAQKQVCGGGRYKQGIGFAIGFDRLEL